VISDGEMSGIHARWIITLMQDVHTRRNRAAMQFPRHAVRSLHFQAVPNAAVAVQIFFSVPYPAAFFISAIGSNGEFFLNGAVKCEPIRNGLADAMKALVMRAAVAFCIDWI